ncbi:uncharacterized protein EAF01_006322 [Botrytis porri]|uniref:Uncharacterized protein n=1 Tax=Botrytis porri TaxID=87229 RepID=A0A4Z1K4U5_9HELO|nr:uncharacterized protein EAF01_006322 [Botrytis porri]KAF7903273.1 hypothetical protein EAF01_006322 [Botrytis porri]TGO80915.1 hypothetical protein BPOR_1532g00010 [Botrytis porri]
MQILPMRLIVSLIGSDTLGPAENFPTLAYIGPNDFRYNALMLGAAKAGYKMFFSSPQNSIPAHANLFKILDCKVLITVNPALPMTHSILKATGARAIIDFEEMLEKNPAIKLSSFYEGLAKGRGMSILENKKTVQASEKLRGLKGIEGAWVEKWVQGWIE